VCKEDRRRSMEQYIFAKCDLGLEMVVGGGAKDDGEETLRCFP
jgi:hypothetical protein